MRSRGSRTAAAVREGRGDAGGMLGCLEAVGCLGRGCHGDRRGGGYDTYEEAYDKCRFFCGGVSSRELGLFVNIYSAF